MQKLTTEIKHERQNNQEFGYGIYINGYVNDGTPERNVGIWASECLSRNATPEEIKKAERRVRAKALRTYRRDYLGQ